MAVDLPGHGESDPMPHVSVEEYGGVVADVLDALGLGSVIAVGHSLGGAIALALASQRSGRVRGLVLLASCVKLPEVDGWGERFLALSARPFSQAPLLFYGEEAPLRARRARRCGRRRDARAPRLPTETILKDVHAAKAMDLTGPATRSRSPP